MHAFTAFFRRTPARLFTGVLATCALIALCVKLGPFFDEGGFAEGLVSVFGCVVGLVLALAATIAHGAVLARNNVSKGGVYVSVVATCVAFYPPCTVVAFLLNVALAQLLIIFDRTSHAPIGLGILVWMMGLPMSFFIALILCIGLIAPQVIHHRDATKQEKGWASPLVWVPPVLVFTLVCFYFAASAYVTNEGRRQFRTAPSHNELLAPK